MEMIVHLHKEIFDIVKDGVKDVEIRLNDEKRKRLSVGDTLIFINRGDENEKIKAKVNNLVYFNDFTESVNYYKMEKIYLKGTTQKEYLNLMKKFYSDEEQEKLAFEMKQSYKYLRPRFSPGYGDFDINYQKKIVQLLDSAKQIGLTLTEGCMMVPTKSVTAFIGISDTNLTCHRAGCEVCTKEDCLYRRDTL